jgi:hypothetical protein
VNIRTAALGLAIAGFVVAGCDAATTVRAENLVHVMRPGDIR